MSTYFLFGRTISWKISGDSIVRACISFRQKITIDNFLFSLANFVAKRKISASIIANIIWTH
jgi:hypothetical protein